ncbi:MAG: YlbF family regulator [Anaeroglobus sp.]
MEDVFVKADALAKAVGECEDYKNLLAAGEKLAAEESTRKNVRDYLILQAKLAYAQSMGDKPVKKKIEELNRLADIIKNKPTAMEYLLAYNTWQSKAGDADLAEDGDERRAQRRQQRVEKPRTHSRSPFAGMKPAGLFFCGRIRRAAMRKKIGITALILPL